MGQVFYKLFYHAVWHTKNNSGIITGEIENVLFPFFENKAKRFKSYIHRVNGTANHIHMAITIPPACAPSDIIGKLKGSSSYFLNMELRITQGFDWQDGFSIHTFSEKDLPRIVEYIDSQKIHHQNNTLDDSLESL